MTQTQINDFWEKERQTSIEIMYIDQWGFSRDSSDHESDEDCDETEIGDAPEYEEENE